MNQPIVMSKITVKAVFLLTMLGTVSVSSANGFGNFFGGNNNNGFGNFFGGNNNNCNNWPIWTPMYWMEEMTGSSFGNGFGNNSGFGGFGNNNRNCYNNGYGNYNRNDGGYGAYGNLIYQNPYQSPYGASPYMNRNPYASGQPQAYRYRPPAYNSYSQNGFLPFGGSGMGGFPSFGNSFGSNPFSSFGGSSSPMSMGTMGMPGMSPMSSFGGSPFGGSSFMPFR